MLDGILESALSDSSRRIREEGQRAAAWREAELAQRAADVGQALA